MRYDFESHVLQFLRGKERNFSPLDESDEKWLVYIVADFLHGIYAWQCFNKNRICTSCVNRDGVVPESSEYPRAGDIVRRQYHPRILTGTFRWQVERKTLPRLMSCNVLSTNQRRLFFHSLLNLVTSSMSGGVWTARKVHGSLPLFRVWWVFLDGM